MRCTFRAFREVIAFAYLFDDAVAVRKQLEFILRQPILVHILTDSKIILDIISKVFRTSEKRVMFNRYAPRKANKAQEIRNIGFVRSSYKLADVLTKPKVKAALSQLLSTAYHQPMVEQWIIRDPRCCIVHQYLARKHDACMVYLFTTHGECINLRQMWRYQRYVALVWRWTPLVANCKRHKKISIQ